MGKHSVASHAIAPGIRSPPRFELIVIAASAGGLAALLRIVGALPGDLDVPIVIVQHRGARNPQMLPRILRRASALPVKLAEEGELPTAGTIYVAPADFHVLVQPDRTLHLTGGTRIEHVLSSANPLFESAAEVLKDHVLAVVLTGSGFDGTDGVLAVRAMGGVVIAQDPDDAEHPGMPASAIRSGAVNYIVPLERIAPLLVRLANGSGSEASPAASRPR